MDNLTNDAKFLIGSLYKEYLKRRVDNTPKRRAVRFSDAEDIRNNYMPEWQLDDVEYTCAELVRNGFIDGSYYSNRINDVSLTTYAIANLEVTFSDKFDKVIDFLAKIKSIIPFV